MPLGHSYNGAKRTQDVKISQNVTFETMLLNGTTLEGLKASGFYKPSPIQLHGIPLGKCGFDLLLEAKSGTGKTAVFTVIALEKINLNNGLQVVILAPTREIAAQICDVIRQIGSRYPGLTVETVMGGLPVKDDIEKLKKKVHIVVGSPGRLHHLINDKHVDVSRVRLFVLDEADKLMEKSFRSDIDFIFSALPQQKQIIFSSATFPEESKAFINQYVQVHQHICPDSNSVLLGISQKVTFVKHNTNIVRQTLHKFEELLNILSKKEFKQCLIFCNYQARVTELYKMLKKAKWPAEKLYGQQEQIDRLEALKTLQEYKCRILIATDLAARGLDSSHVDLVINFEPPYEWQTYLHRIGRAGRFGSYGLAVTIITNQEEKQFKELLNSLQFQLDIRDFWTDDQFVYTDVIPSEAPKSPELDFSVEIESAKVSNDEPFIDADDEAPYNMFEYETPQYEIETFDQLCASFNEANDKVETINDLLESFQNSHVQDTKDITTEVKGACATRSDANSKSPNCVKSDLDSLATSQHEEPSEYFVEDKQSEESDDEEIIHIIEGSESENSYKENMIPNGSKKKGTLNILHKNKTHKIKGNANYEAAPTSFNNGFDSGEMENDLNVNIIHDDFIYKKANRKKDKVNTNSNYEAGPSKNCTRHDSESSDDSNDYGYNTASYDFKRSHCNSINDSESRYTCSNIAHQKCVTKQKQNSFSGYSKNYINWYNYLKFRTQQIEMFFYINEISKLYK